jgi:photosystem II stability/assembly factor-like uncharacterized protein
LSGFPPAPGARARTGIHRLLALAVCFTVTTVAGEIPTRDEEHAVSAPLVSQSLFLDGAAIDEHMVVVGERGHILVSRDAGISWIQAQVPTRATLTGVSLYDHTLGWAVGHDAIILRTRDGGLSWEVVYAAPQEQRPLLDVWFENAEHGIAVGAYGYFLETRDGGDTWQSREIDDDDHHLNHIAAASSQRLYIAAEAGNLYRSDDAGHSWQELPSPYEGSFFGLLPVSEQRVYLYGLRGHLFHSDDAGVSWRPVGTRTRSLLTGGIVIQGNGVLFTGMGGTVLMGDDSKPGVSALQRTDRRGIAGALDAGAGAIVLFGEFGVQRLAASQLERLP